jgi:hypothetical protein
MTTFASRFSHASSRSLLGQRAAVCEPDSFSRHRPLDAALDPV